MPVKRVEAQFLGLQAVPHCMVHRGGDTCLERMNIEVLELTDSSVGQVDVGWIEGVSGWRGG